MTGRSKRWLTAVMTYPSSSEDTSPGRFVKQLSSLAASEYVGRINVLHTDSKPDVSLPGSEKKIDFIRMSSWLSGEAVARLLETAETDLLLLLPTPHYIELENWALKEFLDVAAATGAGLIYSDYRVKQGTEVTEYSLCDYQFGSIRQSFDFGGVMLISRDAARASIKRYGPVDPTLRHAGLYELRLKISSDFAIQRIPQPLYTEHEYAEQTSPAIQGSENNSESNVRTRSMELEDVANQHLQRIGAYLETAFLSPPSPTPDYNVTASIIVPVRNREQTIGEALESAAAQKTSFPFNVIVIDDHSTDCTGAIVRELAGKYDNIVHLLPERDDLGVGGLWNEAIYSKACGLVAVQLDSDDVYAVDSVLQRMVEKFWEGDGLKTTQAPRYAMVIGSFAQVNSDLQKLPGKPEQHRDLTSENARHNSLRVDGMGAPRAFYVPVLRQFGFPNVSFGEDYAVCLRMSRDYAVGRIFDVLYLARQWEGNTMRSLPLGNIKSINFAEMVTGGPAEVQSFLQAARRLVVPLRIASGRHYHYYKDWLRTLELRSRIALNRQTFAANE